MKIDRNLNLVIPVITEKSGTIYIHSVPISRDIFEQFYLELGKVFTECFSGENESHVGLSAPQLAYPALKSISKKVGNWDGPGGVKFGLINEIIRLTNVSVSGERGWETVTFDSAVKRGLIDEDEEAEILSSVVFFTVISKVAPKGLKIYFLQMAASLRNWQLLSLDATEFRNSLLTSTAEGSTGETATQSSIIS